MGSTVTVTFDQPLDPGVSAAANWRGRTGLPDTRFLDPTADAAVAGSTVTFPVVSAGISLESRAVRYLATPADVRNRFLERAPAFDWFAMT